MTIKLKYTGTGQNINKLINTVGFTKKTHHFTVVFYEKQQDSFFSNFDLAVLLPLLHQNI